MSNHWTTKDIPDLTGNVVIVTGANSGIGYEAALEPTLRAAVNPQAAGGLYFGPGGFQEIRGYPVVVESSAAAHDATAARKLWSVSEELTGVKMAQLDGVVA